MKRPASRETHLPTLRENRSRRFESGLKPLLEGQEIDAALIGQRFFQDMALLQNRTRGPLFELAGEVLLMRHLQRRGHAGAELRKQARFPVEDGLRIADFYGPAIKTIFEVKSGYLTWSKPVRRQAEKDAWLLKNSPDVGEVVWLLFRGASARALAGLKAVGIECFDLGFGEEKAVSKPTTVIRV